ncbi:hypothetical protein [Pseudothauera lacus]|uniref:Uncharacterized protein n=1 Tax=Pseudothauera lacus TaxID=2136175 RepID=A0A2T4II13_9RHOO|nr:hypothetical protein [Pseudothauera lacus]PTD97401.1 hypothetical protein C8261_05195 [Pseudothauera lacus]
MGIRLKRLYQPRNPSFWLMVAFNLLSSVLAWVLHGWPLTFPARLLLTVLALANAGLGMAMALRLLREPPAQSR